TLTIELSITCMSAASTTANAMMYLCGSPSVTGVSRAIELGLSETGWSSTADWATEAPSVVQTLLRRPAGALAARYGEVLIGHSSRLLHSFNASSIRSITNDWIELIDCMRFRTTGASSGVESLMSRARSWRRRQRETRLRITWAKKSGASS